MQFTAVLKERRLRQNNCESNSYKPNCDYRLAEHNTTATKAVTNVMKPNKYAFVRIQNRKNKIAKLYNSHMLNKNFYRRLLCTQHDASHCKV